MRSQNGWPVLDRVEDTRLWDLPGVDRHVRLAAGAAGFVLIHWSLWFHEEIEPLDKGVWDEWGWAVRDIAESFDISNHASGTAVDLNATKHPLGTDERASFPLADIARINRRLATMDRVIRWGGNYDGRQDPMHFELDGNRRAVRRLAATLRDTDRGRRIMRANRRR
jgi:hypothetical protein